MVVRGGGLRFAAVVSGLLTMIFLTLIGAGLFGKRLGPLRLVGLACTLLVVLLFSLSQTETPS